MTTTAFYAGSFDPVTNGHLDIIRQALCLADELVVGIGEHATKNSLFDIETRKKLLEESVKDFPSVSVITFDDLLVTTAKKVNATLLVRGIRDGTDLDYEMKMSDMNSALSPDIPTIFLLATPPFRSISSSLVRQIVHMGGDVSLFVPSCVIDAFGSKK